MVGRKMAVLGGRWFITRKCQNWKTKKTDKSSIKGKKCVK